MIEKELVEWPDGTYRYAPAPKRQYVLDQRTYKITADYNPFAPLESIFTHHPQRELLLFANLRNGFNLIEIAEQCFNTTGEELLHHIKRHCDYCPLFFNEWLIVQKRMKNRDVEPCYEEVSKIYFKRLVNELRNIRLEKKD
jgi:hypothetical protein